MAASATPTIFDIEDLGDGESRQVLIDSSFAVDTAVYLYNASSDAFVMLVQAATPFIGLPSGSYYCKVLETGKTLSSASATVVVPDLVITESTQYISLEDATLYFDDRLNSQVWYDAEPNDQSRALKTATRMIDRLNFIGSRTSTTQALQFPRGGDTTIPSDIKYACCEIAYALLDGIDVEKEIENLDMVSQGIGNVRSTYARTSKPAHILAGIPSIVAWRYLLPYLPDPRIVTVTRVN